MSWFESNDIKILVEMHLVDWFKEVNCVRKFSDFKYLVELSLIKVN